jgi:zinc protease
MVVTFKPTQHMSDEVLLTGVAAGGLSEVPASQHYTAACAGVVASHMGIFGIRPALLNDFLAGTRLDVATSEGAYSRTFKAALSPEDLETAMQLLHLLFTTTCVGVRMAC